MGAFGEHLYILGVALVYLAAFEYLQTDRAVVVVSEEGTSARLAHVAYNSAHAHRAVELFAQIDDQFGILKVLYVALAAAQVVLDKAYHLLQTGV